MSTDTATVWQAPMFFDPEQLEGVDEATTLAYSPPVMLPEDQPLEPEPASQPTLSEAAAPTGGALPAWVRDRVVLPREERKGMRLGPWLLGTLGTLLAAMLVVDAYRFIGEEFTHSLFTGSVFLILTLGVVALAAGLSWRAWRDLKRVRTVSALQSEGAALLKTNGYDHAQPYLNKLARLYAARGDVRPRFEQFYATVDSHHHDGEVCALFSQHVLKDLDERALRVVVKRSNETALMVMISPMPLLSSLLTLWRTTVMVREVATLYNGRPGAVGMFSLFGLIIHNLLYADVSEMLAESVAETFGGSMLSVVSAHMAQGIGSSLLTARVGLRAMQACRPMPFLAEEKPKLGDVRREIVKSLKQLVGGKK